ncbi:S9 family peptidase [candidate division KSB1 bacterium]|nr:S9 family peptidase [candidate division KSB1 bacterium]
MMRVALLLSLILFSMTMISTAKSAADLPLEEFFKTYRVGSLAFSPDESEFAFISDKSGKHQAYRMPVQGGDWQRLLETDDAITSITWCPTDRSLIIFGMDQGGDENYHLYRTTPAGQTFEDLTPWAGKRATLIGWSHNGYYLYFNSNRRDDRFMDTYRLDVRTMQTEVVFENNTTFSVDAISPDDRVLILNEFLNVTSSNLYTYDVTTKETKAFTTQADGEANYGFADFSPDGKLYYVLSDRGSEFTHLKTYDPATQQWATVLQPEWDVVSASFSYKNTYLITAVNEGGISRVTIVDHKSGKPVALPPLPAAEIIPVGFSRSERYLRIYVNADNIPGDQYVFDLHENKLTKLTDLFDTSELREEMMVTSRLVSYPSFDGKQIPAWLYIPKHLPKGGKAPVVIDVHGGPMAQETPAYKPWTQFLLSRGFIVASPNVRGSTGYGKSYYLADDQKWGEDPLQDVVYLKKYLAGVPEADTSRTVIWGGSYGGYMVLAALAFTPEEFTLGLDWVGPSNLFTLLSSIPPYWEPYRAYFYKEIGNPELAADSARMYKQSPVFFADRIQRPLFIVQGRNDPRVKVAESDQIVDAARKNGKEVEYLIFEDEGHGLRKRENKLKAYAAMYEFMRHHLGMNGTDRID